MLTIAAAFAACKGFIQVDPPPTATDGTSAYADNNTAAAVMTGMYTRLSEGGWSFATGPNSVTVLAGLSADELTLVANASPTIMAPYYRNNLSSGSEFFSLWSGLYNHLHTANAALEGLEASNTLTPDVKRQLKGEALFMRALIHFYLVNLYGDVPLILTSDYRKSMVLSRSPVAAVNEQIVADLKEAKELLTASYAAADALSATNERVRPNKWAAAAMLARVYTYTGDWSHAEKEATAIIGNKEMYDTVSLRNVFLQNSREAIWQLQPISGDWNTEDARLFILRSVPSDGPTPLFMSGSLLNTFEQNDKRKTEWVDSFSTDTRAYYFPYKYKSAKYGEPVTEYLMVLRLAEQYLIRAEAFAQQHMLTEAAADLNIIRRRAGLPPFMTQDKESMLSAIRHERQVELFTEFGHRWLDMKRSNLANTIMPAVTQQKGGTWRKEAQLFPLPQSELEANPKLAQNPGYH